MATKRSPASPLRFFRRRFVSLGTPRRAVTEKAYLKSELRFYGVRVPEVRRAAVDFARAHPELSRRRLRAIVDALYETGWHDLRSAGIALLSRRSDLLGVRDLPWLVRLVRRSNTWAHVDWLAVDVIGRVVEREPVSLRRLRAWARDDNFWVRRTALLAQLRALGRGAGDFDLFARLADGMLGEREFFIRKAIGWVLREVSKKRPKLVYEFLRRHRERTSALTLQEGTKYLPAAQRKALALPPEPA